METEDIEKLKEAAFAAAELLKSLPHYGSFHGEDRAKIIASIEAFNPKPEPEPFEAWGNFYEGWVPCLYRDPERAKSNAGEGASRVAVHIREVTPAPEWDRWEYVESGIHHGDGSRLAWATTAGNARVIAEMHNAEMKRLAVHIREVTPPPEWERWDENKVSTLHGEQNWKVAFTAVADAHNAEMKRVTGKEGK